MAQTVFIPKETDANERRVAASPDTVKRLSGLGFSVVVEAGAGAGSRIPDADFAAAGAAIGKASDAAKADLVLKVRRPGAAELAGYRRGALVVATIDPYGNEDAVAALAKAGVSAFAMEFMPRITRAQVMDVLSSQANLAGYRAVIDAAAEYDRALPMMMTAAGTVAPASVFVIGAGVAGLQAIATARRLGARVSATDVRPAAKEEIRSLGAAYVGVETEETKAAQTAGGYAKEMSDDFRRRQAELMAETVKKQDIIICTALTMGRSAPKIISAEMVTSMKPGSVIVDIASDAGGNCALTKPGERVVTPNGVTILGWRNWPGRIAVAASALYARNLLTFLTAFWDKDAKKPNRKPEDEIVQGVALPRGGAVVHPQFAEKPAAAA